LANSPSPTKYEPITDSKSISSSFNTDLHPVRGGPAAPVVGADESKLAGAAGVKELLGPGVGANMFYKRIWGKQKKINLYKRAHYKLPGKATPIKT
jgi:hypothetical protein